MQPTRHTRKPSPGWLVIGRRPGQRLFIGEHTLTYVRRHHGGGAVFTVTQPDGLTAGRVLAPERTISVGDAEVKWFPRSAPQSSSIRIGVRAPEDIAIRREELPVRPVITAREAVAL